MSFNRLVVGILLAAALGLALASAHEQEKQPAKFKPVVVRPEAEVKFFPREVVFIQKTSKFNIIYLVSIGLGIVTVIIILILFYTGALRIKQKIEQKVKELEKKLLEVYTEKENQVSELHLNYHRRMVALLRRFKNISQLRDRNKIFKAGLDLLKWALDAAQVSIMLIDNENKMLVPEFYEGYKETMVSDMKTSLEADNLFTRVIQNKKSLDRETIQQEPELHKLIRVTPNEVIFCAPLMLDGNPIGIVNIEKLNREHNFPEKKAIFASIITIINQQIKGT